MIFTPFLESMFHTNSRNQYWCICQNIIISTQIIWLQDSIESEEAAKWFCMSRRPKSPILQWFEVMSVKIFKFEIISTFIVVCFLNLIFTPPYNYIYPWLIEQRQHLCVSFRYIKYHGGRGVWVLCWVCNLVL